MRNVKRGFNRLFLVVTLTWATFWAVLYPLHRQWVGQQEAIAEHEKENKNCDALVVERPEWDMTKNCYQRSSENFQNALGFYSFKNFLGVPRGVLEILPPHGRGAASYHLRRRSSRGVAAKR